jgi:hypothetical protein
MKESQVINAWIEEGKREGELISARWSLLTVIERWLVDPVPEDLRLGIEQTTDSGLLARAFDAALHGATLEQLRAVLPPHSCPSPPPHP